MKEFVGVILDSVEYGVRGWIWGNDLGYFNHKVVGNPVPKPEPWEFVEKVKTFSDGPAWTVVADVPFLREGVGGKRLVEGSDPECWTHDFRTRVYRVDAIRIWRYRSNSGRTDITFVRKFRDGDPMFEFIGKATRRALRLLSAQETEIVRFGMKITGTESRNFLSSR